MIWLQRFLMVMGTLACVALAEGAEKAMAGIAHE
ncbi:hypothetical protein PHLH6_57520 [Pseudomonas sp. Seg1]|nr:hypothetical protein PHLH6_57520 [Pseudomonas sp. Seg1]